MNAQTPRILGIFLACMGCRNPWSAARATSVGRELRVVTHRAPVDAWFARFYGVQRALSLADRRRLAARLPLARALHQLDDVRPDQLAVSLRTWFDAHPIPAQRVEAPEEVIPEAAVVRWRDRLTVDASDADSDRALAALEAAAAVGVPRASGDVQAMLDLVAQCLRRDIVLGITMTALEGEAAALTSELPAVSRGVDAATQREFAAARDVLAGVHVRAESQRSESSLAAQRWLDAITPPPPEDADARVDVDAATGAASDAPPG